MEVENVSENEIKRLIKALEKIAEKKQIYYSRNDEVFVEEPEYKLILEIISHRKPDYVWVGTQDKTGYYKYELYLIENWAILWVDWVNAPGWCAEERDVTIYKLPS